MTTTTTFAIDSARMRWLPVALFASVMGLSGLSQAWKLAHLQWGAPVWIAQGIGCVAVLSFVLLVVAYGIKAATGFIHVKAEFEHPVAGMLFGTPLISALLLPGILASVNLPLARGLWTLGAIAMTAFALVVIVRWLEARHQRAHASPAWLVPLVGMLDIPLAVPALNFIEPPHAAMVSSLSIGLFFVIPLFAIVFARLTFEEPLPAAAMPSLFILIAPFAVGFSAYVVTVGKVDLFAEGLFALTLFILVVLLARMRNFARSCPFRLSWWVVSFPLAAAAGAALRYTAYAKTAWSDAIAMTLLALASLVIAALLWRTLVGIVRGELSQLSQ